MTRNIELERRLAALLTAQRDQDATWRSLRARLESLDPEITFAVAELPETATQIVQTPMPMGIRG